MGFMVETFSVENSSGLLVADIVGLGSLSEGEFNEWYLAQMEDYVGNRGKDPVCNGCSESVETSKDLRRYFGRNLHSDCFMDEYSRERDEVRQADRDYFDLVARITL
tara:strand:- start:365 stop:685 length:321 start_codon:yes stop_codon:yes gene_type:complete